MFSQLTAKTATTAATVKTSPKATSPKGKGSKTSAAKLAPVKTGVKFAIQDYARPRAGAALTAHTAAFLDLSGMIEGQAIPKQQAAKIIGARATQYHTDNGNFQQTDKGLILTDKGIAFFLSRNTDLELLAAYVEVLSTGKVNPMANVKTEAARIAL